MRFRKRRSRIFGKSRNRIRPCCGTGVTNWTKNVEALGEPQSYRRTGTRVWRAGAAYRREGRLALFRSSFRPGGKVARKERCSARRGGWARRRGRNSLDRFASPKEKRKWSDHLRKEQDPNVSGRDGQGDGKTRAETSEVFLVSKKVKTSAFQADRFIVQNMIIRKPKRRVYGLSIRKPHGL